MECENNSFLFRSRGMRRGTVAFCFFFLLFAVNDLIEEPPCAHAFGPFSLNVHATILRIVLLVANVLFYAWIVWGSFSWMRDSRILKERIVIGAITLSFVFWPSEAIPNQTVVTIAAYGNLFAWVIASFVALRMAIRCKDERASVPVEAPKEQGFLTQCGIFLMSSMLATAGIMLAVDLALHLLYPSLHFVFPNFTQESRRSLNFLPYFPLQIGTALLVGFFIGPYFKSRVVFFVWIVPLAVVTTYVVMYQPESVFESGWVLALSRLFGTRCRPPDCVDQVFVAAPLYTALAFALGSWIGPKKWRSLQKLAKNSELRIFGN